MWNLKNSLENEKIFFSRMFVNKVNLLYNAIILMSMDGWLIGKLMGILMKIFISWILLMLQQDIRRSKKFESISKLLCIFHLSLLIFLNQYNYISYIAVQFFPKKLQEKPWFKFIHRIFLRTFQNWWKLNNAQLTF